MEITSLLASDNCSDLAELEKSCLKAQEDDILNSITEDPSFLSEDSTYNVSKFIHR